ncbi:hypothetical protein [Yoonia sp. SDW83-1]|uniref:hypothetical protein n=1 Tax=Yoonia sp. SDW83-1 TaxID=3366945 RepID=UPI00398C7893
MWQEYWDIWVYDVFGGRERLAFAIAFGIVGGVLVGLLKPFFRNNTENLQKRFLEERRANVAARLGPGATAAEIDAEIARQIERDRQEALGVPEIMVRHAARPANAAYYATVRDFAQTKREAGDVLLEPEGFAIGPLALAETMLGDQGLAHLDSFGETPPFRGWELRQAMEQIGLPEMGQTLEKAVGIHLHRYQLISDMMATGMPIAQAQTHPDLPGYDDLEAELARYGGQARLREAADAYFEAVYPWAGG